MIVITGGAGFIGSCLLKTLNNQGVSDILVVDNLSDSSKWHNLLGKSFRKYLHKDEFISYVKNGSTEFEIDCIVHLGACSKTTEPDCNYLMSNNYSYSIELAEYCLKRGIRFIYASSAATYGNGANGYSDEGILELKPLNPYGFSKQAFDMWALNNGVIDKITGLKFFNVYGPNEYHKASMHSMIYKAYNQVKEAGKVKLFKSYLPDYADGEQKRDFVYIKDVCNLICKMITDNSATGIYNIGTGIARSWNDLAKAVFSATNKNPFIEYINMPDNLINQYQYYTLADTSKLMKLYPDFKFSSLEDGVLDYVQNYLIKDDKYL